MGSTDRKEVILPMNVLGYTGKLVSNRLLPAIPKKHHSLFIFGLQAFSFNSFQSLASNARQVVGNTNTAASKVYRLTTKKGLVGEFKSLVGHTHLVMKDSLVNVDFSSFCGFETLAFAAQTNLGRAIPVWIDCIRYPIKDVGSQNLFIIETIKEFGKTLGFYPSLVFDRGFMIPTLIEFLVENQIQFYLRIKAGHVCKLLNGKAGSAKQIGNKTKDVLVTAYGATLRLIVSPPPPQEKSVFKPEQKERWYILTNDTQLGRKQVLHIYRCRFEIEEVFKDIKHIADLKKFFLKKKLSFKILLWLVIIGFWLAWWSRNLTASVKKVHPKKLRSWFRSWWEELQRLFRQPTNLKLQFKWRLDSG